METGDLNPLTLRSGSCSNGQVMSNTAGGTFPRGWVQTPRASSDIAAMTSVSVENL
jgi:hypothetical protein